MKTAYLFALSYFAIMALLLLASGIWIFVEKIGFTPGAIVAYYAGDEALGRSAKSIYGQLEVTVPHLGAIGLFIMVIMHFLIFVPKKRQKYLVIIALITFSAALLNIASGIFVSVGYHTFAMLKLIAFSLFSLMLFWILSLVLAESLRTLHHQRYL
jgi:hypothetical protein